MITIERYFDSEDDIEGSITSACVEGDTKSPIFSVTIVGKDGVNLSLSVRGKATFKKLIDHLSNSMNSTHKTS